MRLDERATTLPANPLTEPRARTAQPYIEPAREDGLERLAWWLDSAFVVPGTRFRIGLDALIGLVPGLGDLIGTALSAYIVAVAARRGLPRSVLLRMALNVGVEALVGIVPIAGDLFDAAWKANQRNVGLLRQYAAVPHRARAQSRLVVAGWLLALLAVAAGLAVLTYAVIRWLWLAVQ